MKKEVIILSDKVAFYMRFSTQKQADAFNKKKVMFNESKTKNLLKNEKIPNLLDRRINQNGIF